MLEHLPNWLLRWFVTLGFCFIFVWKRLIRGYGKPGKLREFNFAEFVSTLEHLKQLGSSLAIWLYSPEIWWGSAEQSQRNGTYRVDQQSRSLRLKACIFCLYLQTAQTNFHNFWNTSSFLADRTIGHAFGTLCHLSVVCDILYCGKTVCPSEKLSEEVNKKPWSKSWFFGLPPYLLPVSPLRRPFLPYFCPYSPAIGTRWYKWTF